MTPAVSQNSSVKRRDIHQQVTDTIIQQLETGTIPWHKPWKGKNNRLLDLPYNFKSGKKYRGINILLLWISAMHREYESAEWGSFLQWREKKEAIRKGQIGTLIVYYDTFEKEVDGEIKEIPFLKSSIVFNRCQLASYEPTAKPEEPSAENLVERIEKADQFIVTTQADIEHRNGGACYVPSIDKIYMPHPEAFFHTETCTATEGYYSTLLHELTHWTGNAKRLNRQGGKKFGDNGYATEELVAELGAAFLCAEFDITMADKGDHANYIAGWLKVLKENKHCVFTAASEASKAVDYLHGLKPSG